MDKRVWLAVNRTERKMESYIVGTSNKAYAIHCLMSALSNCKNGGFGVGERTNTTDVLATDGNYVYDKVNMIFLKIK